MPDKRIVLMRGEGYNVKEAGITVVRGEPFYVEERIANDLLELGFFQEAEFTISEEDELGLTKVDRIRQPKNALGNDDLNGKSILLRRHGAIGDVMFVVVIAQLLKSKYPMSHITMAVIPKQTSYVSVFDCVDEVIDLEVSSRPQVIQSFDYIVSFAGVIEDVHPEREDYFELHRKRAEYTEEFPTKMPRVGITQIVNQLRIQEEAETYRRLAGIGEEDEYIVLLTGTSSPLKRMHSETLQTIADRLSTGSNKSLLSEKTGRGVRVKRTTDTQNRVRVLCMGDGQDRMPVATNQWISSVVDAPLPVCVELIRKATLVIGADTGLLHTAAAIGVPTVSVWGPTNPEYTIRRYLGRHIAITAGKDKGALTGMGEVQFVHASHQECSPCGKLRAAHCPYYSAGYTDCMRLLNTDLIVDAANELLCDDNARNHPARSLQPAEVITPSGAITIARTTAKRNVAVLFDVSDMYTGGGFYVWSLVKSLAKISDTAVHVYYDRHDVIYRNDIPEGTDIPGVTLIKCDALENWTGGDIYYDLVVGTPPNTGVQAAAYARKEKGSKSLLLVYETPGYIAEYRKGLDGQEVYWQEYKEALLQANMIFCISSLVREKLNEWCPALSGVASIVAPCINTEIANKAYSEKSLLPGARVDQVVLIARNERYKRLRETLACVVKNFAIPRNVPLNVVVIGGGVSKLKKQVDESWSKSGVSVVLKENVTEAEKWAILTQSKALIQASDFEGFGITLAEAAYAGTPVLCHPLEIYAECFPDVPEVLYTSDMELVDGLHQVFDAWRDHTAGKEVAMIADVRNRRAFVKGKYTEKKQASTVAKAMRKEFSSITLVEDRKDIAPELTAPVHTDLKVAIITTWNTRCGIAETTKEVIQHAACIYRILAPEEPEASIVTPDGPEVNRCWQKPIGVDSVEALVTEIVQFGADVVHIHHEFSFIHNDALLLLLQRLRDRGIATVITMHTFLVSGYTDKLEQLVDAIVLPKEHDELSDKFVSIPLPCAAALDLPRTDYRDQYGLEKSSFVVGTFGFWVDHKGQRELLQAYNSIAEKCGGATQIYIVGYCSPKSMYASEVRRGSIALIENKRVVMCTDFLTQEEIHKRLSCCDVLVFNYNVIGYSSSSAAIRTGMAAARPIVCTQSPMFSEFESEKDVLKVPFGDTEALATAISRLRNDEDLARKLVKRNTVYLSKCSAKAVAQQYDALYTRIGKKGV